MDYVKYFDYLIYAGSFGGLVYLISFFKDRLKDLFYRPHIRADTGQSFEILHSVREFEGGLERFEVKIVKLYVKSKWFGFKPSTNVSMTLSLLNGEKIFHKDLYWNHLKDLDSKEKNQLYYSRAKLYDYSNLLYDKIKNPNYKSMTLDRKKKAEEVIVAYALIKGEAENYNFIFFPTEDKLARKRSETHILEINFDGDHYTFRKLKKRIELNFDKAIFKEVDC